MDYAYITSHPEHYLSVTILGINARPTGRSRLIFRHRRADAYAARSDRISVAQDGLHSPVRDSSGGNSIVVRQSQSLAHFEDSVPECDLRYAVCCVNLLPSPFTGLAGLAPQEPAAFPVYSVPWACSG